MLNNELESKCECMVGSSLFSLLKGCLSCNYTNITCMWCIIYVVRDDNRGLLTHPSNYQTDEEGESNRNSPASMRMT